MKLGPDLPGREPDIMVLFNESLERIKKNYVEGPADIAIEIVSPESEKRDRGEKFYEYAAGGVGEYWVIDPVARWADFYRLDGTHYRSLLSGSEGEFRSELLPGFFLHLDWLWQSPRPSVLAVLRELGMLGA
jgi:Uma2 family endonuclease